MAENVKAQKYVNGGFFDPPPSISYVTLALLQWWSAEGCGADGHDRMVGCWLKWQTDRLSLSSLNPLNDGVFISGHWEAV